MGFSLHTIRPQGCTGTLLWPELSKGPAGMKHLDVQYQVADLCSGVSTSMAGVLFIDEETEAWGGL